MKYQFIEQHREAFAVAVMCRALQVSKSGYYDWRKRGLSQRAQRDAVLTQQIKAVHEASRRTYGSPRVWAELQAQGTCCGRKRIARLMRLHGLRAKGRGRYRRYPRQSNPRPAENVLNREFSADAPNEKWVADISYIRTDEGWLYLAVILDIYSRMIVGWSMASHLRTELIQDALNMALARRMPQPGLLHHSDRGSQYTSQPSLALLKRHQVTLSFSRPGNCYDNAMMESFFATLKTECVDRRFRSRSEARQVIFEFIEVWYNRMRRHSSLGYLSPARFEAAHSVTS